MKRKIALTGGTGFIGQYLIRDYSDKYDFVIATSGPVPKIGGGYHTDYSKKSFKEIFQGCDAIVHLGSRVPNSVTLLEEIGPYLENVITTEHLLQAAVELNIQRVIFTSSVSVYEKNVGSALSEDNICMPDNVYGISKAAAEMLFGLYAKRYGIEPIVLRVSQVLGYRHYKSSGFYSMLQNNAYENKQITLYGEGKACRDYIYVKDVCAAIDCSLQDQAIPGVYNIGSGVPTSNLALAEAYCKVFENDAGIVHVSVAQEDGRFYYTNIHKAKNGLGWEPQYDLTSMITDIKAEMLRAKEKCL